MDYFKDEEGKIVYYDTLGEELTGKDIEYDNISGESTEFYVSEVE